MVTISCSPMTDGLRVGSSWGCPWGGMRDALETHGCPSGAMVGHGNACALCPICAQWLPHGWPWGAGRGQQDAKKATLSLLWAPFLAHGSWAPGRLGPGPFIWPMAWGLLGNVIYLGGPSRLVWVRGKGPSSKHPDPYQPSGLCRPAARE